MFVSGSIIDNRECGPMLTNGGNKAATFKLGSSCPDRSPIEPLIPADKPGGSLTNRLRMNMSKKLYVGNLSFKTTESDITNAFSQCGAVESVRIITDRETGRSKGFGFV